MQTNKNIIGFMKRILVSLIILMIIHQIVIAEQAKLYDIENHWGCKYIMALVDRGIAGGYPDGSFRPDNTITRAEFCKLVVDSIHKVDEIIEYSENNGTFSDVPSTEWFTKYIETAHEIGLVGGKIGGEFEPNTSITREEAAKIVAIAYAEKENTTVDTLQTEVDTSEFRIVDFDKVSVWAIPYMKVALKENIFKGDRNRKLNPQDNLTRAEATAIIVNTFKFVTSNWIADNVLLPFTNQDTAYNVGRIILIITAVLGLMGAIYANFIQSKNNKGNILYNSYVVYPLFFCNCMILFCIYVSLPINIVLFFVARKLLNKSINDPKNNGTELNGKKELGTINKISYKGIIAITVIEFIIILLIYHLLGSDYILLPDR